MDIIETDVAVIGAGSSGCVIAGRLSERAGLRVTVLEAGGSDLHPWVRMPIGYGASFYHPRLNWRYYTDPETGLNGRRAYWPRGKVLGGSSSVNAMVFIRGQARDYDLWAEAGNTGWSYEDLLPHFRRMENNLAGADQWRARGGPVTVRSIGQEVHPLARAYVASAVAAGHTANPDFNGATQEGVGFYQITTKNGFRASAATAYLHPAMKRGNLQVVTHAHVTRILFDGKRATGVEYRHGDRVVRLMARRQVVLSAGAVGSPQILELSGVGDPERLAEVGIDTVHALPGVGENLQDHVGFDLCYLSKVPTLNRTFGTWTGRMAAGLRYVMTRRGPLSLSVNHAGGFVRSDPSRQRPNIQLYMQPMSYTRGVPGKRALMQPDAFQGVMIGMSNCHPLSRGSIHLRSADPGEAPSIRPNYFSAQGDLEEMVDSAALLRSIAAQDPLAASLDGELKPGPEVTDREGLTAYVRDTAGSIFHPCGTCAMGTDPGAGAVVAPDLRVHGVEGLTVADASVMPLITSGNLNAPALMIGEKAASLIAARL
jgi:choline dehydrogenase